MRYGKIGTFLLCLLALFAGAWLVDALAIYITSRLMRYTTESLFVALIVTLGIPLVLLLRLKLFGEFGKYMISRKWLTEKIYFSALWVLLLIWLVDLGLKAYTINTYHQIYSLTGIYPGTISTSDLILQIIYSVTGVGVLFSVPRTGDLNKE